jgi:hypothetical protein
MFKVFALVTLAVAASAASISWTGYASDGQWNNHNNWYPNSVPSVNDDVTIPNGVVQVTTPVAVNSLLMGTQVTSPANLTLFADFNAVNGLQVAANGNLFVDSAAATISAGATIVGGTLTVSVGTLTGQWALSKGAVFIFQTGVLSGTWTLGSDTTTLLQGASQKALVGASLTVSGALTLGGLLAMNSSSVFTLQSATQIVGGLLVQVQDGSACVFDASAAAAAVTVNGGLTIMATAKFNTLTLQTGNVSLFSTVTFKTSLAIPHGIYVFALGAATVDLTPGVTGSGTLVSSGTQLQLGNVNMKGTINCMGGTTAFSSTSTVGTLSIGGGTTQFSSGVTTTQLNLLGGILMGTQAVAATNVWSSTKGINIKAPITVSGVLTVAASLFNFGQAGSVTLSTGANANVQGMWQITGNTASVGIVNNGAITATAGISLQNINLGGTGTVSISKKLYANTNSVAQSSVVLASGAVFSGANTQLTIPSVSAPTSVLAVLGHYSFTCTKACQNVDTNGQPTSPFSLTGQ